jgi:hypothetical protein
MTVVCELADLANDIIKAQPDGQIFNTITYGSVSLIMGPYGANISVGDRWAIVAYVRALQLSRLGTIEDVPIDKRASLKK